MQTSGKEGARAVSGGLGSESGTHSFELTGGSLCLDFANTVDERPRPEPRGHLLVYKDLCDWAEQAGVLEPQGARALWRAAEKAPQKARRDLSRAKKLRESLFSVFSNIARGEEPDKKALDSVNKFISGVLANLVLVPSEDGFVRRFSGRSDELERPLNAVALSALDLLTSPSLDRIRLCASERCDWLFLDNSKNRSRRWCDMSVCGNRAKASRHYQKKKVKG
jgi:predicted RNA-binding Zn ribbon-like protein